MMGKEEAAYFAARSKLLFVEEELAAAEQTFHRAKKEWQAVCPHTEKAPWGARRKM